LRLKEKYGGLKKFLEGYPAIFVVSSDHPFNPNVLLRASLTPDQIELLEKGIFPHQLLMRAKKVRIYPVSLRGYKEDYTFYLLRNRHLLPPLLLRRKRKLIHCHHTQCNLNQLLNVS
jgi:hypothetical protein